ncbi:MAG: ABC transporter permease [Halobacteriaceae archaeon]
MATEDRETFEDVDWEEVDAAPVSLSWLSVVESLVYVSWLLAFAYDYFVVPAGDPTFEAGWFVWNVTEVEWVFVAVLLLGVFHVLVPLYRNPRMTRYYWSEFRKNRAAVAALGFLVVVFVGGLVGPAVLSEPTLDFGDKLLPPVGLTAAPQGEPVTGTWAHPLGTDHQGQDILKLIVFGMRVSMEVGLITMAIAVTVGTVVGTVAAHFGGRVDEALMRYVDLQQSFPTFILLLLMIYLFGSRLILIIGIYGLLSWEGTARLIRSEALQRREEAYIQAAEAAGASRWWVIRRHLIPNVSSTVITSATLAIPIFILTEASLSFLGLSDPNIFSWGKVISNGQSYLATAPWIATIPGVFLFFTVLAFNFVGDALRDAIDPRGD